jgi:hypothetical protein
MKSMKTGIPRIIMYSLDFFFGSFRSIADYEYIYCFCSEGYELMGTTYDVTCIPDDIVCNTTSYRSFDGTCNNLNIPIYGAAVLAVLAQSRFLDPEYADGICFLFIYILLVHLFTLILLYKSDSFSWQYL